METKLTEKKESAVAKPSIAKAEASSKKDAEKSDKRKIFIVLIALLLLPFTIPKIFIIWHTKPTSIDTYCGNLTNFFG